LNDDSSEASAARSYSVAARRDFTFWTLRTPPGGRLAGQDSRSPRAPASRLRSHSQSPWRRA